jgi:nitrate/TMAO reductase-like tetraheme cytochrome c subunit
MFAKVGGFAVLMRSWVRLTLLAVVISASFLVAAAATIQGSEQCGRCHTTIYQSWKGSVHAEALGNENFLLAFRATEETGDAALAQLCLKCHAPVTELNGDKELLYHLTWEGVNCDICHSVAAMKKTKTGFEPVLKPGDVKYGPFEDAVPDAHEVQGTAIHTQSEMCAWCHEYTNPEGTPILATWSEWKKSKAAENGVTCQNCHMGEASASATDPRLDRDPGAKINLHSTPGGHSLDQLHKALSVSLQPKRDGDKLDVEVVITNKGAGHAVPTGMPGRRVIMTTQLRVVGGETHEATRVFGKSLETAKGELITRDRDYFTAGVRLKSDTTIQPDEQRKVLFHYQVPARSTAILTVKMFYEHTYSGSVGEKDRINFLSQKRTIRPSR